MPGHIPVLIKEAINHLNQKQQGIYIDATFGAGGYTKEILKQIPESFVYGIDRDLNVKSFADQVETMATNRFKFINDNNANLKEITHRYNIKSVDGIVFDLGVSSMQLETADRGFSFMLNGLLDMRMGNDKITAADVINTYKEKQLADIIYFYGEEQMARKIAKAIVLERNKKRITTTKHLADIVKSVITVNRKIHPATKTFQALRIFVNNELENLELALQSAVELLSPKGSLVVVSFHSIEDRIVKHIFKYFSLQQSREKGFALVNKKTVLPSDEEVFLNNRARSAKLRAIVREF